MKLQIKDIGRMRGSIRYWVVGPLSLYFSHYSTDDPGVVSLSRDMVIHSDNPTSSDGRRPGSRTTHETTVKVVGQLSDDEEYILIEGQEEACERLGIEAPTEEWFEKDHAKKLAKSLGADLDRPVGCNGNRWIVTLDPWGEKEHHFFASDELDKAIEFMEKVKEEKENE